MKSYQNQFYQENRLIYRFSEAQIDADYAAVDDSTEIYKYKTRSELSELSESMNEKMKALGEKYKKEWEDEMFYLLRDLKGHEDIEKARWGNIFTFLNKHTAFEGNYSGWTMDFFQQAWTHGSIDTNYNDEMNAMACTMGMQLFLEDKNFFNHVGQEYKYEFKDGKKMNTLSTIDGISGPYFVSVLYEYVKSKVPNQFEEGGEAFTAKRPTLKPSWDKPTGYEESHEKAMEHIDDFLEGPQRTEMNETFYGEPFSSLEEQNKYLSEFREGLEKLAFRKKLYQFILDHQDIPFGVRGGSENEIARKWNKEFVDEVIGQPSDDPVINKKWAATLQAFITQEMYVGDKIKYELSAGSGSNKWTNVDGRLGPYTLTALSTYIEKGYTYDKYRTREHDIPFMDSINHNEVKIDDRYGDPADRKAYRKAKKYIIDKYGDDPKTRPAPDSPSEV